MAVTYPADLAALLDGVAETERGPRGGLVPHRLPGWAREQHDQLDLVWGEACPAGGVLRLRTAAGRITLRAAATVVELAGLRFPDPPRLAVRDGGRTVVRDLPATQVVQVAGPDGVRGGVIDVGDPATVVIVREPVDRTVEIHLPHNCGVELLALDADAPVAPAGPAAGLRWLHYGSSISHCVSSPSPERTWPAQVAAARGWTLRNLAFSGNAQLDPFAARVIRDAAADLITLKVGINVVNADSMRQRTFLPAVHGFLDTIREGHPETPIVVVTAIGCPMHEDAPGPAVQEDGAYRPGRRRLELDAGALTLAATRTLLARAVAARRARDPRLFLVDGRELLGADEAHLLTDALHPSQEGYDLMARRFPGLLPAAALGAQAEAASRSNA
ncbi:GDSL-type esterase/lipase family protein [Nonomuraea antri]|uniref:GDSL-type esterase/lipase family protein n=1 Tax=Nonomuraea antri TaxID=2730852 RepID=UPI001C2C1555|nr:GDSL-type esterase/lipase family protein [Nonomuraea antri]